MLSQPDTDELMRLARSGDEAATSQLLVRYRDRLKRMMRHLEQLHVTEIAAVLKLTEPAVKSRLRRALERLHCELGDDLAENVE